MTDDKLKFINKLYPDILTNNLISLSKCGNMLSIYNKLEGNNDYESLKKLGLLNFKYDLKWILDSTDKEYKRYMRKKKLEHLNGL